MPAAELQVCKESFMDGVGSFTERGPWTNDAFSKTRQIRANGGGTTTPKSTAMSTCSCMQSRHHGQVMSKRRKRLALIACGIFAVGLTWMLLVPREREPSYQGRKLSEWVEFASQSIWTPSGWQVSDAKLHEIDQARSALRTIGTNALPPALKWIRYDPSPFRQRIVALAKKRFPSRVSRYFTNPEHRAAQAVAVFEALGADARPAIPELTRLARTSSGEKRSYGCIDSLHYIGSEALPNILMLVTNSPPLTRWSAVSQLRYVPNPEPAVPVLAQCLDDKDSRLADKAAETLSSIVGLCAVTKELTNCMRSLSNQGRVRAIRAIYLAAPTPTDAANALVPYLNDADFSVREASTNALRAMAPKVFNKAPP